MLTPSSRVVTMVMTVRFDLCALDPRHYDLINPILGNALSSMAKNGDLAPCLAGH